MVKRGFFGKIGLIETGGWQMIKGIGIDLVELERIADIIQNRPSFIQRVLTPKEYETFQGLTPKRQIEYLGGRFACKEAFSKAYGTGIGAVSLQEIEILTNKRGAPQVTRSPHKGPVHVSITHTDTLAMAQIILEEEGQQ
ncbi:holo-[acyl-carrier-protein] synthase [Enterococcus canis]|uniref:Holo-[acyl-carrier-protein] synthase n=2 Tax=Enterococcus canis TaxID=214095 RepID=A0A1L8RDZ1_9ENTE|nr:holo-[acyl-carrier-protein] synthase [Enterococcus canis]